MMVNEKINDMYEMFSHFTRNSWVYETKMIYELDSQLTPDERLIFYVDPKSFDWISGTLLYAWGGEKYIFG
jgi:Male sterility protein